MRQEGRRQLLSLKTEDDKPTRSLSERKKGENTGEKRVANMSLQEGVSGIVKPYDGKNGGAEERTETS